MQWSFFLSLFVLCFEIQATVGLPNSLEKTVENYPLESYVKMRCSVDPTDLDTYMQFRGFVYSTMDGTAPMTLFQTIGVNVANCLKQKPNFRPWNFAPDFTKLLKANENHRMTIGYGRNDPCGHGHYNLRGEDQK